MDIFVAILLFSIGIVVVVKGADIFVSASSWVSDVTGASKILIGVTLVAMATSGPELFVSLIAAMKNQIDMSVGNVVGSHLCNLGLGYSLIAAFRPSKNSDKLFTFNGLMMIVAAVLLYGFSFLGVLEVWGALIFIVLFALFTFVNIKYSEVDLDPTDDFVDLKTDGKVKKVKKPTNKKEITINVLKFILGLAGIILGSNLIVDNASILAKKMGVSEMFIGLTIVAIGTSLPEIVTTIVAIVKKEDDLGIGNIFGSCIFNNLFILAIAAFVTGGLVINENMLIDLPIAILMMVVAVLPSIIRKEIKRYQGISLMLIYCAYMVYLIGYAR